jgi:hypothetical protein
VRPAVIGILGVAVLGGGLVLTSCASTKTQGSESPPQPGSGSRSGASSSAGVTSPSSVDVTLTRKTDVNLASHTLTGTAAINLASLVNGLTLSRPGTVRCMADSGASDRLVFHAGAANMQVEVKLDPCGSVQIVRSGGVPMTYGGQASVNSAVLAALGLPPNT